MVDDKAQIQKYPECSTCTHWGTVFSYKRLANEMMCGFGSKNCDEPEFGKRYPTGYKLRESKKIH